MASSADAFEEGVVDLVKCSICLEVFTEPKTLSTCQHTFCEKCLINWVRNKREAALRQNGNPTNRFPCPECREPFTAETDQTIKNMRCSHVVRNFHDLVIKQQQAKLTKEKEPLRAHVDSLQRLVHNRKVALRTLNENSRRLKNDATRAKNEIQKDKERIQRILTDELQRRAELLTDQVDVEYKKKIDIISKQQAVITTQLQSSTAALNSVKDLLDNADYEKLLSSKKLVLQKVDQVKQKGRDFKQVKPVGDGGIKYQSRQINDDELKQLVASCKMGKICSVASMQELPDLRKSSTILQGKPEYIQKLVEWVPEFQWRRVYRASRDGWTGKDFHRKCDGVGATVTLVKVDEYIFGGYTDHDWTPPPSSGFAFGYKRSDSSFLFSIKNKDGLASFTAPLKPDKHQYAILTAPNCGPIFGIGFDLFISANPNTDNKSCSDLGQSYSPPTGYVVRDDNTQSLLAGSHHFIPSEIEVFY